MIVMATGFIAVLQLMLFGLVIWSTLKERQDVATRIGTVMVGLAVLSSIIILATQGH